jgi:hypothetical protein
MSKNSTKGSVVARLQDVYQRVSQVADRLGSEHWEDVSIVPRDTTQSTIETRLAVYRASKYQIQAYRDVESVEISMDTLVIRVPRTIPETTIRAARYDINGTPCDYVHHEYKKQTYYLVYVNRRRRR